eukprot:scaffold225076_cov32-Prasinocladus_malaysianus.AAC.1
MQQFHGKSMKGPWMVRLCANELPHAGNVMPLGGYKTFVFRCTYVHWLTHRIVVSIRNVCAETIEAFKVRIGSARWRLIQNATYHIVYRPLSYIFCATPLGRSRGA